MNFFEKLNTAIARNQSLLFVGLDPSLEMLPQRYRREDKMAALGDWLEEIIERTRDRVCAYKPTLGFYQALGPAGFELFDRILAAIPPDIPVILDAKLSDLNTATLMADTAFNRWNVDAITLNAYAGQDLVAPFLVDLDAAVFVLCCTHNPTAAAIQDYPSPDAPLYLQIVQEAKGWGTPEQLGLEVGATEPEVFQKIRAIAPERLILARSIWTEGGELEPILKAGLDSNGDGLLIPVPLDYLVGETIGDEIQTLNERINTIRTEVQQSATTCDLWMSDVCFLNQHPHQDLILQLFDLGCILFGEYVQASGATFSYYIDLRQIISKPQVFNQVLNAYIEILQTLEFDRIAGIPYGSLPTATGLSLRLHHPLIFPRKEVKAHGTRRVIEGTFQPGEKIVVIDDILISGKSVVEGAEKIESGGLIVEDIVVLIDHEGGVKERLKEKGYRAHSVLGISEITRTLYEAGRLNEAQYQTFQAH
ncbi:bifunctional orotidine-5'-phosphate decarboxylase/orotate phosphoribosyltransferase [Oscillatoria sp. FACHB-1406]|uniref:bifunctional orotidine-5'-phosphate decarboxylase/orotate phosphoribosyltransferase n=1 Tax=Oscillatoria sp. FACHB-1406 TaxID=2692846 RepID=UPI00168981F0|nr:bifunctional orotidine-5'-phosphate decarboxylase/orotate phosphoribosyltransferase [Oscillatoria sp. FACHB-1406]MBD2578515.1 bifunctional orotidine-5'-phosphate decarboxylase/orotate phosphoribosyltransferase [Oscillatoria sp. FACHB-1406]